MKPSAPYRSGQWTFVCVVALVAALASAYFALRYSGRWADPDTANLTAATAQVASRGTLLAEEKIYGLGFAYQATAVFVASATGLSLSQLQFVVYPLVASGLAFMAFVMYRLLVGDPATAALATTLLFLQPDFLFVILRGSHEKVTWLITMLAVFLLARSSRRLQPSLFVSHVALFYAAVLALISSNAFFGSSFIVAVALALVASITLSRVRATRPGSIPSNANRLVYVLATAVVLWFLHTFYLYRPAARALLDLRRTTDQVAAVTLGREPVFDPYSTVGRGWVSQAAYLGLMLPSYAFAAVSFVLWLALGMRVVRGRRSVDSPLFLLWLLYGAFGTQLALGSLLALAGGVTGNVQQRLFPVVMLMAFPLVAMGIVWLWRRQARHWTSRAAVVALCLFVLWASPASLLKATNDPWLGNYWMFWTGPEDRAVRWVESHLRYRSVWLGLDGIRLSSHAVAEGFGAISGNVSDTWVQDVETRDIVISALDESLSARRLAPLPDIRAEHRVYDNGRVASYHLRPRTPYQR